MSVKDRSSVPVSRDQGIEDLCHIASHLLLTAPANAARAYAVRTVLRAAVNKSAASSRGNDQKKNVSYISSGALRALAEGELVFVADHAIPIREMLTLVYREKVFQPKRLRALIQEYSRTALITKDEDTLLRKSGLGAAMPDGWDKTAHLARYEAVGIRLQPVGPDHRRRFLKGAPAIDAAAAPARRPQLTPARARSSR